MSSVPPPSSESPRVEVTPVDAAHSAEPSSRTSNYKVLEGRNEIDGAVTITIQHKTNGEKFEIRFGKDVHPGENWAQAAVKAMEIADLTFTSAFKKDFQSAKLNLAEESIEEINLPDAAKSKYTIPPAIPMSAQSKEKAKELKRMLKAAASTYSAFTRTMGQSTFGPPLDDSEAFQRQEYDDKSRGAGEPFSDSDFSPRNVRREAETKRDFDRGSSGQEDLGPDDLEIASLGKPSNLAQPAINVEALAVVPPRLANPELAQKVFKALFNWPTGKDGNIPVSRYYNDKQPEESLRRIYSFVIGDAQKDIQHYLKLGKVGITKERFLQAKTLLEDLQMLKGTPDPDSSDPRFAILQSLIPDLSKDIALAQQKLAQAAGY